MYDLIIIGGGPAGAAAGVYAGRKKLRTLLVTDSFGGQSLVSDDIQNWIGDESISGFDLAKKLEAHIRTQKEDVEIEKALVTKIEKKGGVCSVETNKGKTYETKTIFLAIGSKRRKLDVPGEKEFEGKGVFYCSICDAPLMKGKVAAVIGGGNSALEAVVDLMPYAEKIYLIHRRDEFRGDPVTQEKIQKSDKVEMVLNASTIEIKGGKVVESVVYENAKTKERKELKVGGVFVEVGAIPNSEVVKDLVSLNEKGEVVVDHKTQRTSETGIWAAGDVTDVLYKQNNISAGDAVKAVLNIHDYLCKECE
ncbi:MAG: FAD-dependent oxidoreductase [bacterium]|nr:FAD-dependent oxidoreductase [bacterium]